MKSVSKEDHPDFVGGVVWSRLELEWIRNRDREWETEIAKLREEVRALEFSWAGCSQQLKDVCDDLKEAEAENKRLREELAKLHQDAIRITVERDEAREELAALKYPNAFRNKKDGEIRYVLFGEFDEDEWEDVRIVTTNAAPVPSAEDIAQAVARGWCHPDNSGKEMDAVLAKAIVSEVVAAMKGGE